MGRHSGKRRARLCVCVVLFATSLLSAYTSSHLFGGEKSVASVSVSRDVKEAGTALAECENSEVGACETNFNSANEKVMWTIFYILAILYVFVALAIVCDDFFVGSLEVICDELKLTPDVAGATFMAAGSSAPELFTSCVGVFYEKSDVGIGTILGSAVFNVLVIIGLTALLAGQVLILDWKPLARDSLFYLFSIILIILMFGNHVIDWYEAALLLVCYLLYLGIMKNNARLMNFLERLTSPSYSIPVTVSTEDVDKFVTTDKTSDGPPSFKVVAHLVVANLRFQKSGQEYQQKIEDENLESDGEGSEDGDILDFPESGQDQLLWLISLPSLLLFKLTIPDCSKDEKRHLYLVTFVASIMWIGVSCFLMADWARSLGCILNINPAIMGLTLLAAGTSVPDALASLFVAQDGEGDMAVSNAIGSNVFDILLGLGLPWMINIIIEEGRPIAVCSQGVVKASILLFLVLIFVVGTLALSGWRLSPKVGAAMFAMYFMFVGFSLMDEYFNLVDQMFR